MKIIGIEGIDGSGKSLQYEMLINGLNSQGYRCTGISFPIYESFLGKEIGGMLSGKNPVRADLVDPKSMALWYAADRMVRLKNFPQQDWDILVLNRYTLSNAVYQGIRFDGEENEFAQWVYELEHQLLGLPVPDVYFVMEVDLAVCSSNVKKKGNRDYVGDSADVYEKSSKLQTRAQSLYKSFGQLYKNIRVIDCMSGGGMKTPEEIYQMLIKEISAIL